jgi:hypothetical protein
MTAFSIRRRCKPRHHANKRKKDDLAIAAKLYVAAKHDRKPFDPAYYGFEFSTADVKGY